MEEKKNKNRIGIIIACFIASISLFLGLVLIESNVLKKSEKIKVVKCIKEIEKGTVISSESVNNYFEITKMDASEQLEDQVTDLNTLIDQIVTTNLANHQTIRKEYLVSKDSVLAKIATPIEVSIKVPDVSQAVGGILREGDIVDVSVVNSTTNENVVVLKNAYVAKAINTTGAIITKTDRETSATTINLIIDKKEEALLNQQLSVGTVRISKQEIEKCYGE